MPPQEEFKPKNNVDGINAGNVIDFEKERAKRGVKKPKLEKATPPQTPEPEETDAEAFVKGLEKYDNSLIKNVGALGKAGERAKTTKFEESEKPLFEKKSPAIEKSPDQPPTLLEIETILRVRRSYLARLERELLKKEKERTSWSRVKRALKGSAEDSPELLNLRNSKAEAEKAYYESQITLGKKMSAEREVVLRRGSFSEEAIKEQLAEHKAGEVFTHIVLEEEEAMEKERQNLEPKKEKGFFEKAREWYSRQHEDARMLATATTLGAIALATGGASLATAYFAKKAAGAYGGVYGATAGVAVGTLGAQKFEKMRERRGKKKFGKEEKTLRENLRKGGELGLIELADARNFARNKKRYERKTETYKKGIVLGSGVIGAVVGGGGVVQGLDAVDHATNFGIRTSVPNNSQEDVMRNVRGTPNTQTYNNLGSDPDEFRVETEELNRTQNTTPNESRDPIFHRVLSGETNINKVILSEMRARGLDKLIPESKAAQTNFIENMKRYYSSMSPEDLKRHVPSGDLNKIKLGDQIGLPMFNDTDFLNKNIARAQGLSPEQISGIESYGKTTTPATTGARNLMEGKNDFESGAKHLKETGVETAVSPEELAKTKELFIEEKFGGKWYKPWADRFIWNEGKNLNASRVLGFQGEYGGVKGADGGVDYGRVGESNLRNTDFSKLKETLNELSGDVGAPTDTETVEQFTERALRIKISGTK